MTVAIKVINATHISEYKVSISFSDGTERIVDFRDFLEHKSHPQFAPYRDLKNFKKFRIERGNVVWGKDWDLIFPVEELYAGKIRS